MNFIEDFAETIKNIQGFRPDLFAGATEADTLFLGCFQI